MEENVHFTLDPGTSRLGLSDWSGALATELAVLAAKSISYRLVGSINLINTDLAV